jgi:hypothetical protein
MKTYTVSVLKRLNFTVEAESPEVAIKKVAPWWPGYPPIDGSLVLGVVEGRNPIASGHGPPRPPGGKPPSGPTPGTPVLESKVVNG